MFAVVEIAGQQFKVEKGTKIDVQKLDSQEGESVSFNTVLLVADGSKVTIGEPYVAAATVGAKILDQFKDDKVRVFKKNSKKRYMRNKGHRQNLTKLEITEISA
jgi:large subunit ribosomal protein L21